VFADEYVALANMLLSSWDVWFRVIRCTFSLLRSKISVPITITPEGSIIYYILNSLQKKQNPNAGYTEKCSHSYKHSFHTHSRVIMLKTKKDELLEVPKYVVGC